MGTDAFWIVLTGALVAVSSGLLGGFLLLRRMALIGDAISHAVLPGIVAAYLLSGSLHSLPALLGAAAVGLLSTVGIEALHRRGGLPGDASMGMVFTFLFALGVIGVSAFGGNADLDQECVLYGELAFVGFTERWMGIPAGTAVLAGNLVLVLAVIGIGWRGLFLTTFDPAYAAAIGVSTAFWHYLLMALVSLTTVVSFEAVGAILVVAFLIGPAAIGHLLTDRLPVLLGWAVASGVGASLGGYALAAALNANVAGSMTAVLGLEFVLAFALGPYGWRARTGRGARGGGTPDAAPDGVGG